jgi:hypothetical protein
VRRRGVGSARELWTGGTARGPRALQFGGGTATERRGYKEGRGRKNMRFCETKPIVILAKSHLTYVNADGYVDYTKMTNGFVPVRNAHARSHYPTGCDLGTTWSRLVGLGFETTRGGLPQTTAASRRLGSAPFQGARL